MIIRIELFFRRLRRHLSRSQWAVKLLKLPRRLTQPHEPGLLILQIDGLSRNQLQNALEKGRMPFLQELLDQEEYHLVSNYSGVPSTTPAVQGELFYGEKQAVPSFNFIERESGRERVMFDADSAHFVARQLRARNGDGLLKAGASYSNILAGDANEARFCSETLSLENWFKKANPFSVLLVLLLHIITLFRIAGLMILETGLALHDCVRGIFGRHHIVPELKFALSRIGICILLRELIRFMVKADIARGLPIIHANFLGYDEQAHRRGPDSAFAHWSLKGIDGTIKDIFSTAMRAHNREYHVLVMSDHGQETAVSYNRRAGEPILKRLDTLCREAGIEPASISVAAPISEDRRNRARHHFRFAKVLRRKRPRGLKATAPLRVTAMGPLGHVYFREQVSHRKTLQLARLMVSEAGHIPWVFLPDPESGGVTAISRNGEFKLTDNPAEVLGGNHPFLTEAAKDLEELCRHRNAGDLVMWGGGEPKLITFAKAENGAHGGPGRESTHAFLMHPPEIHPQLQNGYIRPLLLRHTIQQWFASAKQRNLAKKVSHRQSEKLRVVTYNIHSCIGMDGKVMPERIAAVLRRLRPDVVALQEVDSGRRRSFNHDQLGRISKEMGMYHIYFPLLKGEDGEYGIAVLSRYPFETLRLKAYDIPAERQSREERGIVWLRVNMPEGSFHFMNTHFGLLKWEKLEQASQLTGADFLGSIPPEEPVVLCGDFNSLPGSEPYEVITKRLHDIQRIFQPHKPLPTFFGRRPMFRIDHIFVSDGITVNRIKIPHSSLARTASDHLPLGADIEWKT
ncbi:MAG: endonuclease/exonuclease/phosphatase family protein [Lentisphaeria bacterium]